MIKDFEQYTNPLSKDEMIIMNIIIDQIKHRTIENPILAKRLIRDVNQSLINRGIETRLAGSRLRKIVNHIRGNGLFPLRATVAGYYMATNTDEIKDQIESLNDRIQAMTFAVNGLKRFLDPDTLGSKTNPTPANVAPTGEQSSLFPDDGVDGRFNQFWNKNFDNS